MKNTAGLVKIRRVVFDFKVEEAWLNKMASAGYKLEKPGFFFAFYFSRCASNKYTYVIEFLKYSSYNKRSIQYIDSLRESGANVILTEDKKIYIQYDRSAKPSKANPDTPEQIERYKRAIIKEIPALIPLAIWVSNKALLPDDTLGTVAPVITAFFAALAVLKIYIISKYLYAMNKLKS